jgi:hypothetical protein
MTTTALQMSTHNQRMRNSLVCTNKNCGHQGHTIKDCYWPGGRKQGQFPPGFGKKNASKNTTASQTSANAALTDGEPLPDGGHNVFALAAITIMDDAQVQSNIPQDALPIPNAQNNFPDLHTIMPLKRKLVMNQSLRD